MSLPADPRPVEQAAARPQHPHGIRPPAKVQGLTTHLRESYQRRWVPLVVPLLVILAAGSPCQALAQPAFSNAVSLGTVNVPGLVEASGMVASGNNDAVLWTHNDKGDSPRIFAIDTRGRHLGTYDLPADPFVDYEDIAVGPGPVTNVQYLYVGNIGDNKSERSNIKVYRIPEPAVYLRQALAPVTRAAKGFTAITLTYPDGAHNAETLLVDPLTGDLFVVTKQTSVAGIYQATKSQLDAGGSIPLVRVGQIAFNVASGGDISPTGREIVIRQEDFARLWTRSPQQSIAAALQSAPVQIPVVGRPTEPNGEAIGFDPIGRGYFTLSDSSKTQPLYYFARTSPYLGKSPQTLVNAGSTWRFLDTGADLGTSWRTGEFADSGWSSGAGQLGYGGDDEQTIVSFGPNSGAKYLTTYFRNTFVVTNLPPSFRLNLKLLFNDGAAVFLNGALIALSNLSSNATYLTPAIGPQDDLQDTWFTFPVNPALLVQGTNTLAVEVHLSAGTRGTLSFDAQLSSLEVTPTRITAVTNLTGGRMQLGVESDFPLLSILATTNWGMWSAIGNVALTNDTGVFIVPRSIDRPFEFYQLSIP